MKKIFYLFLIPTLTLVTGCDKNKDPEIPSHTIKFETNGGEHLSERTVADGGKLEKVTTTLEGYNLVGWFEDEDFDEEFDFNTVIRQDYTLYAKWEECDPFYDTNVDDNLHYLTFYGENRTKILSMYVSPEDNYLSVEPFFPKIDLTKLTGYSSYEWVIDSVKYGQEEITVGYDAYGRPIKKLYPKVYNENYKNIDVIANFIIVE